MTDHIPLLTAEHFEFGCSRTETTVVLQVRGGSSHLLTFKGKDHKGRAAAFIECVETIVSRSTADGQCLSAVDVVLHLDETFTDLMLTSGDRFSLAADILRAGQE